MKIFILLLIISCSKVIEKRIDKIPEPVREIDRLETDGSYSEKIDVMVAFLWPVRIETALQKESVRSLIRSSREMKDLQDVYFQKKVILSRAWKKSECDCVLNQICGETIPETPIEECLTLEEDIFQNERLLPAIYEIVEKMKESVKNSGGEWLKTHTDFPEGPVSEMDFSRSILNLPVFDSEIKYSDIPFSLNDSGRFVSFEARFSDQQGRGEWHFDLVLQRTPEALKFQGKLFLYQGQSKREGIVYWMNPVIL